jgi:hypothetical protein
VKRWRNPSFLARSVAAVDLVSTKAGCPLASLLHVPHSAERRGYARAEEGAELRRWPSPEQCRSRAAAICEGGAVAVCR